MANITTRSGKGAPLTNNEVDANFINLNTRKLEQLGGLENMVLAKASNQDNDVQWVSTVDNIHMNGGYF